MTVRRPESVGVQPQTEADDGRQLASLADFAAGVAHEINNPLAIIIEAAGWVEDLLEDELRTSPSFEEMHRALQQVATQAGRCRDITHNLLSFARRLPGKVDDVQLNALVGELVATFEKRNASRKVEVELSLDPKVPTCRLSPTEIQQVLLNLLNNAVDAMESGGRVRVSTRSEGDQVLLEVADTGSGIPDAIVSRIFEPFFTTKPVGKGTGLGLAICHGIVHNLGGSIRVQSQAGVGTTFQVRLPREAGTSASGALARSRLDEEDLLAPPLPTSRAVVLLADNEDGFARTVGKRLERRGFVVHSTSSGQETIAQVEADAAVSVVVLDVKMPDMDGAEVLKEIKRRAPLVEVILLSSHTTVESAIDGMRLGAFDYLIKPCELSVLVSQINRAHARRLKQEERIMEARLREITMRRP